MTQRMISCVARNRTETIRIKSGRSLSLTSGTQITIRRIHLMIKTIATAIDIRRICDIIRL